MTIKSPHSFVLQGLLFLVLGGFIMGCASQRHNMMGVQHGKLAPCPDSPNCVCSHSHDSHRIEPLTYQDDLANSKEQFKQLILSERGYQLVHEQPDYLHFEFTSAFFKFVDDVEFYFDGHSQMIHVRSASRIGHYDFGANRKRIEHIRKLWNKADKGVLDDEVIKHQ